MAKAEEYLEISASDPLNHSSEPSNQEVIGSSNPKTQT